MPHTVVVKDGKRLPREVVDSPSLEMSNIQPGKAMKKVPCIFLHKKKEKIPCYMPGFEPGVDCMTSTSGVEPLLDALIQQQSSRTREQRGDRGQRSGKLQSCVGTGQEKGH